jgi:hypothetical protein
MSVPFGPSFEAIVNHNSVVLYSIYVRDLRIFIKLYFKKIISSKKLGLLFGLRAYLKAHQFFKAHFYLQFLETSLRRR